MTEDLENNLAALQSLGWEYGPFKDDLTFKVLSALFYGLEHAHQKIAELEKKKEKEKPALDTDGCRLTDCWETPLNEFIKICELFDFYPEIDACANSVNAKCNVWINPQQDALKTDWLAYAEECGVAPHFWMNPPYSQQLLSKFVAKAYEESQRGASVLCLLPNSRGTRWWIRYVKPIEKTDKVQDGDGRIKFTPPKGLSASTPCGGNVFVLFAPPEVSG